MAQKDSAIEYGDTLLIKKVKQISDGLLKIDTIFDGQLSMEKEGILSPYVFNKYIDAKFSYLSYQRGTFPSGNSASLDVLENSTQINLSLAKKLTSRDGKPFAIVTGGVQAKLSSGIANIFNGNNTTEGTTLFLNWSFLPKQFNFKTVTDKYLNGDSVKTPFGSLLLKLEKYKADFNKKYFKEYPLKYYALICREKEIEKQLSLLKINQKDTCSWYSDLNREKEKIVAQLDEAGLTDKDPDDIVMGISDEYQDGHYKLITNKPVWEWFKLWWLEGGFTYTRESYTTYNSTIPIDLNNRFGSKDFDAWGYKISSNWFQEKTQAGGLVRSWYGNVGYEVKSINNYALLKDQTILENVPSPTTSPNDTAFNFQTNKKAKDISGLPFATSLQHNFSGAFTAMFFEKKTVGINILAQSQFSSLSKPIFNSRIGVLVSMPNNNYDPTDKQSKTKVNFEIFVQFSDMSDVAATGKTVWQNRIIGVSTNIPFSKIFVQ